MHTERKAVWMGLLTVALLFLFCAVSGPAGETNVQSVPAKEDPLAPAVGSPRSSSGTQTDDNTFNQLFDNNPIDAAYQREDASDTQTMLLASQKYTQIWESEASFAYQKLCTLCSQERKRELVKEQDAFRESLPDQIQAIKDQNAEGEGSVASLTISGEIMDLYRRRTAQLYLELYQLTGTLAFHADLTSASARFRASQTEDSAQ